MPYNSVNDIDPDVRSKLPSHAAEIYKSAFNAAYAEHGEEAAHKIAWSAVKKSGYHKGEDGQWVKSSLDPSGPKRGSLRRLTILKSAEYTFENKNLTDDEQEGLLNIEKPEKKEEKKSSIESESYFGFPEWDPKGADEDYQKHQYFIKHEHDPRLPLGLKDYGPPTGPGMTNKEKKDFKKDWDHRGILAYLAGK